jgi:hypothetical protein
MKIDENTYELIERFNAGELTGDDLSNFLQRIQDDPELAREVEFSKGIDDFFFKNIEKIELREQLEKAYEKTILSRQKNRHAEIKTKRWYNIKKIYKIAAGVLILLGLGTGIIICVMNVPSKNERLYAEYFKVYESTSNVRGDNISDEDKFQTALDYYDKEDFRNSAISLGEICKSNPENIEARFYKGISEMENKNFDNAILSLSIVSKDSTTLFKEQASWYLALCYLEKNDILNTKVILRKIIANSCEYYRKQAVSLMKDLE